MGEGLNVRSIPVQLKSKEKIDCDWVPYSVLYNSYGVYARVLICVLAQSYPCLI